MSETASVMIRLEGQTIPLPADVAASDELIRKALSPFYPDVANAEIKRDDSGISVVKRAGPKG